MGLFDDSDSDDSQQEKTPEITDEMDGYDPITLSEIQFSGLKCRILGTFYVRNSNLFLGSDIENYFSSSKLRVYKPNGESLGLIINYIEKTKNYYI